MNILQVILAILFIYIFCISIAPKPKKEVGTTIGNPFLVAITIFIGVALGFIGLILPSPLRALALFGAVFIVGTIVSHFLLGINYLKGSPASILFALVTVAIASPIIYLVDREGFLLMVSRLVNFWNMAMFLAGKLLEIAGAK